MKKDNIAKIAIFLVLLVCITGAVNATETNDTNNLESTVDETVTPDTTPIDDSANTEPNIDTSASTTPKTTTKTAEDTIKEPKKNNGTQTDDIIKESGNKEIEPSRSTDVYVDSWSELKDACSNDDDNYNIYLNNIINATSEQITFSNSATIIGTPNNYITGGTSNSQTLFLNTNNLNLDIIFVNVTFKDMNAGILLRLATNGVTKFINCSFDNIHTYLYKSSVIWNDKGLMNIINCNFTNCNNGFGAITNFATTGSVQMTVENCRFEDNYGRLEPGAINNCGDLNVTDSTFNHNVAGWWAGAIHTHTFANTRIVNSIFNDNVAGGTNGAGWNGGALFSYSKLEVINSTFNRNNCSVLTGGGAIFGYSYQGSTYNITVDSCNFNNNINKHATGYAGAIGVQNQGYLTVKNSNFTNNSASIGQAIAAISKDEPYCNECINCSCPNCPNCNCTHNVSSGNATVRIYNNIFTNHTGNGNTVNITGRQYYFSNNTFTNSVQNTDYNTNPTQQNNNQEILNTKKQNILGSTLNPILSDENDIVYADPTDKSTFSKSLNKVNDGGIVYFPIGNYTANIKFNVNKNVTIIGLDRDNVILDPKNNWNAGTSPDLDGINGVITIVNMTIYDPCNSLNNNFVFINCTFINFRTNNPINNNMASQPSENVANFKDSLITRFENCDFINSTITDSNFINEAKFTQIKFNNCRFENITADYIVCNDQTFGGFVNDDGIYFSECNFTNVNVKAIVNVPQGTDISKRVRIEDCLYNGVSASNFDTLTEGDRTFINATAPRVKPNIVSEIDDENNLIITLKDAEGNIIEANVEVLININGAETPIQLTNGVYNAPITDLTDITGPITIDILFEETSTYKGATLSSNYVILNATSISAEDLTTEANVAKNLTVTLKDNNNQTLANKEITVSINGQNTTITTDENGTANIPINYAKAGKYTYTLFFAGDNTTYKNSTKIVTVTITEPKNQNNQTEKTNTTTGTDTGSNTPQPTITPKTTSPKITLTTTKTPKTISKKAKKLVISTKLKIGNKIAKKKTVIIIVKGKKYLRKTNNKGVVKLTLTKKQLAKILKKVKTGQKIKVQIKYGKKTITKYIKIKK